MMEYMQRISSKIAERTVVLPLPVMLYFCLATLKYGSALDGPAVPGGDIYWWVERAGRDYVGWDREDVTEGFEV